MLFRRDQYASDNKTLEGLCKVNNSHTILIMYAHLMLPFSFTKEVNIHSARTSSLFGNRIDVESQAYFATSIFEGPPLFGGSLEPLSALIII